MKCKKVRKYSSCKGKRREQRGGHKLITIDKDDIPVETLQ